MGDRASADSLRWNLDLVLGQRGADMADLPDGASGLLFRVYKGKKADRLVTRIDLGVVSLVVELRGHGRRAAEDLGRWKTVVEERRTVDTSPAARAGFPFISTSQFGIEGFRAIRANAVGELNVGPFHHIGFDLPPIALDCRTPRGAGSH